MANDAGNPLRGRRVLIVEDDYYIALDLAEALQERGAIILGPSRSVQDALDLIGKTRPEIAVLDINVCEEKVYPIAGALLARGVPFIFATGYSADVVPTPYEHIPRCQKPVQASSVAKLVAQQLST